LARYLLPAAAGELQDHVATGYGMKPQVALRGLAPHFRVQDFDRRCINLQLATGLHLVPPGVVKRLKPSGDVFDPLHHLLAGDLHGMTFTENPF
jgi:hypothetical protein